MSSESSDAPTIKETKFLSPTKNAIFFLSFDMDYILAAYPGGVRFGKVEAKDGEIVFEVEPFQIPERKFHDFYQLLDNISKKLSVLGKDASEENESQQSIMLDDFKIATKVSFNYTGS